MTGQAPFPGYYDNQISAMVLRGERPQKPGSFDALRISSGVWEIAEQCWHGEEKERPETDVVLQRLETLLHSGACTHGACTCSPWELIDPGSG